MRIGTCAVAGCPNTRIEARGWCRTHYARWRKYGHTDPPVWGKVLPENVELVKKGKLRCTQCNRVKPVKLFYKRKANRLGYTTACRACTLKYLASTSRAKTLKQYGLTLDTYDQLHRLRKGKCWVCGGGSVKSLAVDHNHTNGNVRGLLCLPCNHILGRWKDRPEIAQRAAEYLRDDGRTVALTLGHQPKGTVKR